MSLDIVWAVWNDCNGVFDVRMRRKDAEALLPQYVGMGCSVIPMEVISIPGKYHKFYSVAEDRTERRRNRLSEGAATDAALIDVPGRE